MSCLQRFSPLLLLLVCALFFPTASQAQRIQVFASFEDSAQVAALKTTQGMTVASSTRFPTWNEKSLEVVFPAQGGTLELADIPGDWRGREALLLFVWGMQPGELDLVLSDSGGDSFTKTFPIRTGVNHLQLKLDRLVTMNLRRMSSIKLVSKSGGAFYMDYFALDRFHQVLEDRGRWDVDYTMKIETPHVPWARPFASGPIKVFALSSVANGRAIIELAQRLELNFKATTIGASGGMNMYGFGDFYQQRRGTQSGYTLACTYIADDLLNGPQYDVILWPSIRPWESYPVEIRDNIRRRVENGAGLVLFSPSGGSEEAKDLRDLSPLIWMGGGRGGFRRGGRSGMDTSNIDRQVWRPAKDNYITRGVPFEAFPLGHLSVGPSQVSGEVLLETADGNPVLAVRNVGQGRVVAFGYREQGMIPQVSDIWETGLNYPYHEYMWSLVARAVVWAAGRTPDARIEQAVRDRSTVRVRLESAPENSKVLARVINSFGQVEKEIESAVPAGKKEVSLALPAPLAGGRHFVDLRLLSDDRSLDWATLTVDQQPGVAVSAIDLAADRVQVGEKISGSVRLAAAKKTACELKVRLFDNYDRLVDQQVFNLSVQGQAEQQFGLNSLGALSHLAKVDCEVTVGGVSQDRRQAEIFVLQKRVWDDYDIVMYLFGSNPMPGVWPTIDRQMQRLWVTTLSSYPLDFCKHANYMVQAQTRISGQESPDGGADRQYYDQMKKDYVANKDKMRLVRKYCLNDPAYKESVTRQLSNLVRPWVPFSPLSYYIYEEPSFTCYGDALDICFGEHSLSAMRDWLKQGYQSLEALNLQWGTSFDTWDKVIPDDTYEAQARGNYSSWADHRRFMEITYADCYKFVFDELRKFDPQGIVLNSGNQISGSHNGCDYSMIDKYTMHLNAYGGLEFHRCFNPEIKISGGAGYGVSGKDVFYNFYGNLFKGCNGGAYIFWQYCTLDPDLTLNQSARDMEKGFQEMRGEGIGKLVGLAFPDNHGIAIHYSYPSLHGSWIVDGAISERVSYNTSRTFSRFSEDRAGWVSILKDSGLQFDFIAYSGVENGELLSKGYKVFILPMSIALSEKEVAAIREFVRGGGVVIADALPGVMDEHCRFRSARVLGDVFGIDAAPVGRDQIVAMQGDSALKLKGAKALQTDKNQPILLQNTFGGGQAFLLNYFMDTYSEDKREGRNGPPLEKLGKVLSAAGIQPKVRLTSLAGEPVTDSERYLFVSGSTRLLGLLPDMDKPADQKVRIALDQPSAIYDVREKRYLGSGQVFETGIEPGVPELFAFVSSRISGIEVQAPSEAALGQEIEISFRVNGAVNLRSVAKVTVTDPQGREVRTYGGNLDIVGSTGKTAFRTALNDPPGTWYLEITEVMSGEKARTAINVK